MSVFGYTRVSTTAQADAGESLDVQQRQLQGWCLMSNVQLDRLFVDAGVSGGTPIAKRPEGAALLSAVRSGDTIVAPKLDRMFRSALDALETTDRLRRRGVRVHLLDLGEVTGNGMGKAFMTMAACFAELERDTIRERVSGVKRDQRERGRYLGGKVPFGYRVQDGALIEEPRDQAIIAAVREVRDQNKPLRTIQAEIEAGHGRRLGLATLAKLVQPEGSRE